MVNVSSSDILIVFALIYLILLCIVKFYKRRSWYEAHEKILPTPKFTFIKNILKKPYSILSFVLALSYFVIYFLIVAYLIEYFEFFGFVFSVIIWILTAERFGKFINKLDKKDNE